MPGLAAEFPGLWHQELIDLHKRVGPSRAPRIGRVSRGGEAGEWRVGDYTQDLAAPPAQHRPSLEMCDRYLIIAMLFVFT